MCGSQLLHRLPHDRLRCGRCGFDVRWFGRGLRFGGQGDGRRRGSGLGAYDRCRASRFCGRCAFRRPVFIAARTAIDRQAGVEPDQPVLQVGNAMFEPPDAGDDALKRNPERNRGDEQDDRHARLPGSAAA